MSVASDRRADFTLVNQDREPVTLSAERGHPVVLAFQRRSARCARRSSALFATAWRP